MLHRYGFAGVLGDQPRHEPYGLGERARAAARQEEVPTVHGRYCGGGAQERAGRFVDVDVVAQKLTRAINLQRLACQSAPHHAVQNSPIGAAALGAWTVDVGETQRATAHHALGRVVLQVALRALLVQLVDGRGIVDGVGTDRKLGSDAGQCRSAG